MEASTVGQARHGSATTTFAVSAVIQRSQACSRQAAELATGRAVDATIPMAINAPQRLVAQDFNRQLARFQVSVAVLKGTALGIPVPDAVG